MLLQPCRIVLPEHRRDGSNASSADSSRLFQLMLRHAHGEAYMPRRDSSRADRAEHDMARRADASIRPQHQSVAIRYFARAMPCHKQRVAELFGGDAGTVRRAIFRYIKIQRESWARRATGAQAPPLASRAPLPLDIMWPATLPTRARPEKSA